MAISILSSGIVRVSCEGILDDHHLRNGLNVHKGKITNRAVAEALGYELVEPKAVLAA